MKSMNWFRTRRCSILSSLSRLVRFFQSSFSEPAEYLILFFGDSGLELIISCFALLMNYVNMSLPKSMFLTICSVKGWNLYVVVFEFSSVECLSVKDWNSHSSNIFSRRIVLPITDVPRGFGVLFTVPVLLWKRNFFGEFGHYI